MKPAPWSYTRLDNFENCPKQFYETSVSKRVKTVESEQMRWGSRVHRAFEARLKDGEVLPRDLEQHEKFMVWLDDLPGLKFVEQKIALNRQAQPCGYWDKDVWYRGGIDYLKIAGDQARIIDHKTGKLHTKYRQLKTFALHTFIAHREVETIKTEYYWTNNLATNGTTFRREQMPELWADFTPALKQYAEAFRTDVWQPRPSGLCHGWCSVTDCEHWRPKRERS